MISRHGASKHMYRFNKADSCNPRKESSGFADTEQNTMKTITQNRSSTTYSARNMVKPVHFYCDAPQAQAVHLVGDFNGWDPNANPMSRRVDGWWFIELELSHGHHQYFFLVDGKRLLDQRANGIGHSEAGDEVSVLGVS